MKRKIFKVGKKYVVKLDFISGVDKFLEGEVLVFSRESYSPYDSSFAYQFICQDGEFKTWWINEDLPTDTWKMHFFSPLLVGD
jgi:hypothetical protein